VKRACLWCPTLVDKGLCESCKRKQRATSRKRYAATKPEVRPFRCSNCREVGHAKTTCPRRKR
jgi:hypothetical protein